MTRERDIAVLFRRGRHAFPQIELGAAAFANFVADTDSDRAEDLFLACACAQGDEAAIAVFDSRHERDVSVALGSMALDASVASEVRQLLREKLFVGDNPRIATYRGRGDLRAWVRSVAVRTAISELRKKKREVPVPDPVLSAFEDDSDDPGMAHLKKTYRGEFRQAFRAAFDALPARDRTLLRYKFADDKTIDDIAAIYRVHRATAARRLAKIRESLLVGTRKELRRALDIGADDFDSIVRLIHSQLDVTLSGLWAGEKK